MVSLLTLPTTRSGLPSPSKSPTARLYGSNPAARSTFGLNEPSFRKDVPSNVGMKNVVESQESPSGLSTVTGPKEAPAGIATTNEVAVAEVGEAKTPPKNTGPAPVPKARELLVSGIV